MRIFNLGLWIILVWTTKSIRLKKNIKTFKCDFVARSSTQKSCNGWLLCLPSVVVHICSIQKKEGGKDVISAILFKSTWDFTWSVFALLKATVNCSSVILLICESATTINPSTTLSVRDANNSNCWIIFSKFHFTFSFAKWI